MLSSTGKYRAAIRLVLHFGFADQRRLKIVDAGGVGALANMLEAASDDDTRREAAKALATLSACGKGTTLFSVVC